MKNLKVSSLFHWLYGAVMFLPILLLPVFMIYSHRHTIDSGTLEVPQNEVVDFNQILSNGNFDTNDSWQPNEGASLTIDTNSHQLDFIANTRFGNFSHNPSLSLDVGHTYLLSFYHKGATGYVNVYTNGGDYFSFNLSNIDDVDFTLHQSTLNIVHSNSNVIFFQDNRESGWSLQSFKYIQCFDLTQMFGAGNEPTIQEFNQWFDDDYYSYTLSRKELLEIGTTIYNDTDIMSQATYQLYNATDKYFNISQFFGFENLWTYMVIYWFGGNVTIYLRIFWQLLTYWLVVSIAWLIFDLFMYVPNLAHRWLDRSAIE